MVNKNTFETLHAADTATVEAISVYFDGTIPQRIADSDEHPMYKILTMGNYVSTVDGVSDMYLRSVEGVARQELEREGIVGLPDNIRESMSVARESIQRAVSPSEGMNALALPHNNPLNESPLHSLYSWFRMTYGKEFKKHIDGIAYEGGLEAVKTQEEVDAARLKAAFVTGQLILPVLHTASDLFQTAVSADSPFAQEFDEHTLGFFMGNLKASVPSARDWVKDDRETELVDDIW